MGINDKPDYTLLGLTKFCRADCAAPNARSTGKKLRENLQDADLMPGNRWP
nr:hypothetical protein [Mesorhizobium sp. LCM 4577]